MKPIYYIFIYCFFTGVAFSQVINNLVIFIDDPEPFTLIMNGERYNDDPATKVRAENLNLKKYSVKILFKNSDVKPVDDVITFFGTGNECTFSLTKKGKKKYKLAYLTEKKMPGFETATGNQNTVTPVNTNTYVPPNNTSTPTNTYMTGNGQNNQNNAPNTIQFGPVGINLSKGTVGVKGNVGGINTNIEEPIKKKKEVIKDSALTDLKATIAKQDTEEKKLTEAKAALEKNYFNTPQIKDIMGLLKTDNAKLDYAKAAYKHCKDQKNYKNLSDALTSDDSKKELKKFIDKESD